MRLQQISNGQVGTDHQSIRRNSLVSRLEAASSGHDAECWPNAVYTWAAGLESDSCVTYFIVSALPQEDLLRQAKGDDSAAVRARVTTAREHGQARQNKPNAQLTTREIDKHCVPDEKGEVLLKQAISRMGLSARAYHRILKVARTIADLANADGIAGAHIAEAIQYRRFDRN